MNKPFAVVSALIVGLAVVGPARAAIESREVLKSYFQTGDKPTQQQFATLIDSNLNAHLSFGNTPEEHAISLDSGQIAVDIQGKVRAFAAGETIDGNDDFGGIGDDVVFNPLATGGVVYAGIQFGLGGAQHFGFLQMQQDGPGSATPFAIHLHHFVYEDQPNTPITTFYQPIPEPGTWLVLLPALSVLWRRHGAVDH